MSELIKSWLVWHEEDEYKEVNEEEEKEEEEKKEEEERKEQLFDIQCWLLALAALAVTGTCL